MVPLGAGLGEVVGLGFGTGGTSAWLAGSAIGIGADISIFFGANVGDGRETSSFKTGAEITMDFSVCVIGAEIVAGFSVGLLSAKDRRDVSSFLAADGPEALGWGFTSGDDFEGDIDVAVAAAFDTVGAGFTFVSADAPFPGFAGKAGLAAVMVGLAGGTGFAAVTIPIFSGRVSDFACGCWGITALAGVGASGFWIGLGRGRLGGGGRAHLHLLKQNKLDSKLDDLLCCHCCD